MTVLEANQKLLKTTPAASGRTLKEDGTVVNLADLTEQMATNVFSGINAEDGKTLPKITLGGGQHTFAAVIAGKNYYALPTVDTLVKSSPASSILGIGFASGDGLHTGDIDMTGNTELNFGSGDITVESWCVHTDGNNSSGAVLLFMGQGSGSAKLGIIFGPATTGTVLRAQVVLTDGAGTVIHNGALHTLTGLNEGTQLRHFMAVLDRVADEVRIYVDATLVITEAFTVGGGGNVTLNQSPSRITLGEALNDNARMVGSIYDVRTYNGAATLAQIQARNAKGPVPDSQMVQDALTINNYGWGIDFQDQATWATATEPEASESTGGTIFDTQSGTPTITEAISGGLIADDDNSQLVVAGVPGQIVHVGPSDTYLNLYSSPSASGEIRLTEM